MTIKNKNLLVIYLNEFNFDYLYKGAKKYKCESILKILRLKISTFTKDKIQDFNLDQGSVCFYKYWKTLKNT